MQAANHHNEFHGPDVWDEETAVWYVKNYGDHPTNRMTVELAQLRPDDHVVDVGCGSGEAAREAAARVTRGQVTGVDPSPAMLRFANGLSVSHDGNGRIRFLKGAAEDLPVPDSAATVVLAINSLHHWQDVSAGLAEVMRVLTPAGRFLVADEEPVAGRFGHGEGQLSDPAWVVRIIQEAGFEDVRLGQHSEGSTRMLSVSARRPSGSGEAE